MKNVFSTKNNERASQVAQLTDHNRQSIYNPIAKHEEFHSIKPIKVLNGQLTFSKQGIDASFLLVRQEGL